MPRTILPMLSALSAMVIAPVAFAQDASALPAVTVVKVGEDGRAEVVGIDGYEYTVCKEEGQDGCINPRDAGLDWGNREIDHYPADKAGE